jgi:hypothetical protein
MARRLHRAGLTLPVFTDSPAAPGRPPPPPQRSHRPRRPGPVSPYSPPENISPTGTISTAVGFTGTFWMVLSAASTSAGTSEP